jgi:hypothetical protein
MMARHPCLPILLAPTHRLPCCIAVLIAIAGTLVSAQPNSARSGTYALRDDDRDFRIHIQNSTFPTSEGTERKRILTRRGDRLKYAAAIPSPASAA